MGCCEETEKDKQLRWAAESKDAWKKTFQNEWPFPMCCACVKDPLWCLLITACPCCCAFSQRKDIMELEGKNYYSCGNLDEAEAKQMGCCGLYEKKHEGDCMISTCLCCEAFCCTQCAAQANRWSIQRLGQYRTTADEDCIVWVAWAFQKFTWCLKMGYRVFWCYYCCPLGTICYYIFGGQACDLLDCIATCVYYSVFGCWQTQNHRAIEDMKTRAPEVQKAYVQYVYVGVDPQTWQNGGQAGPAANQPMA